MTGFLDLPSEFCDPETARYLIVSVPYEGTACFLKGTAAGPEAILSVSDQMEHFDEELLIEFYRSGIAVLDPIDSAETPEKEMKRIYETIKRRKIFENGRFPIFLGGEHSISGPIVRAAVEKHPGLSVLQFDAHADLRDSFTGGKHSHASVMRRILELTPDIVQVGIRSFSLEEYRECPERIENRITPEMLRDDFQACMEKILSGLKNPVYITIDIDAFDPSFAPGTGTPEPGGLDWFTVTKILRTVFENRTVIGADIVETAPLGENNVVTEFLAARLVSKLIVYNEAKTLQTF